jgi:hypothetical protein
MSPSTLERSLELHYRLRVLKAAQIALSIPRGPTSEALVRLAKRGGVRAEDLRAKLETLEHIT